MTTTSLPSTSTPISNMHEKINVCANAEFVPEILQNSAKVKRPKRRSAVASLYNTREIDWGLDEFGLIMDQCPKYSINSL